MPTHNLNSNNLSATSGTSLLLQTNQKVPTSKSDHVIIQKQNSQLHGLDNNSIRVGMTIVFPLELFVVSNRLLPAFWVVDIVCEVHVVVTVDTTTAFETVKRNYQYQSEFTYHTKC
jgi:hypothetical protein